MNDQTPDSKHSSDAIPRRRAVPPPGNGQSVRERIAEAEKLAASSGAGSSSADSQNRPPVARSGQQEHARVTAARASVAPSVSPLPQAAKEIAAHTPRTLKGNSRILHQMEQLARLDGRDRAGLTVHIDSLIRRMPEINASDIDLGGTASNGHVWYRIDGEKTPDGTAGRYTPDEANVLILNLLDAPGRKKLVEWRASDFSYSVAREDGRRPQRFRASAYLDMEFIALNMRAISDDLRGLDELNFHPSIERGLMFRYVRDGLTLITGVTGSGKSTTMDAVIDANNRDISGHIVIIGSPIEFQGWDRAGTPTGPRYRRNR
jgi:twitching motility protein PilT